MLPQALVQNTILGSYDAQEKFKINWPKTAPILNLNFFYESRLVDESQLYRNLLRPWQLIDDPEDNLIDPLTFKLHDFFYATVQRAHGDDIPTDIYYGSLVGCVDVKDGKPQIVVITQRLTKYNYNEFTGKFQISENIATPSLFRSSFLSGLDKVHRHYLKNDDNITITDTSIICHIVDNSEWTFHWQYYGDSNINSPLLFTKDIIFCNVYLPDDTEPIYHGKVEISKELNERIMRYEYYLTIPNLNFPSNAILEYY